MPMLMPLLMAMEMAMLLQMQMQMQMRMQMARPARALGKHQKQDSGATQVCWAKFAAIRGVGLAATSRELGPNLLHDLNSSLPSVQVWNAKEENGFLAQ